jgi:xanthine/CO dehydrogenase XdhC/CoxF family maturation factor
VREILDTLDRWTTEGLKVATRAPEEVAMAVAAEIVALKRGVQNQ